MEQLASPNSIRLTADTMHLVQGFVETRGARCDNVKGLTDPLEVFELQGVTGAVTASRLHRSETSHPIPAAIRSSRSLRIVLPRQRRVTDALCSSMVRPASESHDCYWNFAGASAARLPGSRGTRSPLVSRWRFIPVDLMRRNFRIDEEDDETAIIQKITDSVVRLDEELCPMLPYLRHLMAVDPGDEGVSQMDPALRRGELFAAVRQLMLRAAEARPQVIVIEDLHWIDQATESFLTQIVDSVPNGRVLCLFTYRPGYEQPFGERPFIRGSLFRHSRVKTRNR